MARMLDRSPGLVGRPRRGARGSRRARQACRRRASADPVGRRPHPARAGRRHPARSRCPHRRAAAAIRGPEGLRDTGHPGARRLPSRQRARKRRQLPDPRLGRLWHRQPHARPEALAGVLHPRRTSSKHSASGRANGHARCPAATPAARPSWRGRWARSTERSSTRSSWTTSRRPSVRTTRATRRTCSGKPRRLLRQRHRTDDNVHRSGAPTRGCMTRPCGCGPGAHVRRRKRSCRGAPTAF